MSSSEQKIREKAKTISEHIQLNAKVWNKGDYKKSEEYSHQKVVLLDDVLKILAEEMQFLNEKGLLEILASFVHKQWCHWIEYQLGCCAVDSDTGLTENGLTDEEATSKWESWVDLTDIPYSKLTEKQKESDREWARKILGILKMQLVFEKERWKSEQNHTKLRNNKK